MALDEDVRKEFSLVLKECGRLLCTASSSYHAAQEALTQGNLPADAVVDELAEDLLSQNSCFERTQRERYVTAAYVAGHLVDDWMKDSRGGSWVGDYVAYSVFHIDDDDEDVTSAIRALVKLEYMN
ncbi:MAG: hypothetical protein AABY13_04415 [Nanoarchaeota archaeon]